MIELKGVAHFSIPVSDITHSLLMVTSTRMPWKLCAETELRYFSKRTVMVESLEFINRTHYARDGARANTQA
jgi:hypothetical protein